MKLIIQSNKINQENYILYQEKFPEIFNRSVVYNNIPEDKLYDLLENIADTVDAINNNNTAKFRQNDRDHFKVTANSLRNIKSIFQTRVERPEFYSHKMELGNEPLEIEIDCHAPETIVTVRVLHTLIYHFKKGFQQFSNLNWAQNAGQNSNKANSKIHIPAVQPATKTQSNSSMWHLAAIAALAVIVNGFIIAMFKGLTLTVFVNSCLLALPIAPVVFGISFALQWFRSSNTANPTPVEQHKNNSENKTFKNQENSKTFLPSKQAISSHEGFLTPSFLFRDFESALILKNHDITSNVYTRLSKLDLNQLQKLKHVLIKDAQVDSLAKEDLDSLSILEISRDELKAFIRKCEAKYGHNKIHQNKPIEWVGTQYKSYIHLIISIAKDVKSYCRDRINVLVDEIIQEKALLAQNAKSGTSPSLTPSR